ncbi:MAG: rod shape-determining protein [Lachnospiraceae bacterium]|nr:rod shape-determining protein [Lachnospiraceae bacterium]
MIKYRNTMRREIIKLSSKVFGIDFGTSVLKIYKKNEGIIFDEKNAVAICDGAVKAIGNEAFEMYGRTPDNFEVTFPVKYGVVADFANMLALLNTAFSGLADKHGKMNGAEFIVAVPSDISEVECRAFYDLLWSSSAKPKKDKVRAVHKPVANAIGAGLEVMTANGIMVVDIGAETTEIAVMALGGIVNSKKVDIGGTRLDETIITSVKKRYNLIIGNKTAELIKKELACALPPETVKTLRVFGRDVMTGLPTEAEVDSAFVYEAVEEHLHSIVDAVKIILEKTPPEIASDILDTGIYLTGGSANIKDLDKLFAKETELDIHICDNSANTVVVGLGRILENAKYSDLRLTLDKMANGG